MPGKQWHFQCPYWSLTPDVGGGFPGGPPCATTRDGDGGQIESAGGA